MLGALVRQSSERSSLVSGCGLNSSPEAKNPSVFSWFSNNLSLDAAAGNEHNQYHRCFADETGKGKVLVYVPRVTQLGCGRAGFKPSDLILNSKLLPPASHLP